MTFEIIFQIFFYLEVQAQEAKIEKDENPNEIRKCSAEIEGEVVKFEQSVQELQEAIKRANQTEIEDRAEVNRAEVAQVTKFSYLKELLEPKVRTTIDGLPFTTEGYERAKNILKTKYGKTSEIVNAYVLSILSLPTIKG